MGPGLTCEPPVLKNGKWASDIAQWVNTLVAKLDNLGSVPRIHIMTWCKVRTNSKLASDCHTGAPLQKQTNKCGFRNGKNHCYMLSSVLSQ